MLEDQAMGFGRLRVRTRIFAGFGLLVVLGLAMAGFTLLQLGGITVQIAQMTAMEGNVARVAEANHAVETVRRASIRYRLDQNPVSLQDLKEAGGRARQLLIDAGVGSLSPERQRIYQTVLDSLRGYDVAIARFLEQVNAASSGQTKLNASGDELTQRTNELLDLARATGEPPLVQMAAEAERAVLLVRIANLRFISTHDPDGPAVFAGSVAKAVAAISLLDRAPSDTRIKAAQVSASLTGYSASFHSYAAASLASADVFDKEMRPLVAIMQSQLGTAEASLKTDFAASVATTNAITSSTTLLQSLLATIGFVAGTGLAVLIGRGITVPLGRMTAAMTGLAAGDKTIDIPARDNTDEIGDMARAVEVFRQNAIDADRLAAEQEATRAARARRQDTMDVHTRAFGTTIAGVMTSLAGSAEGMRRASDAMSQAAASVHEQATVTATGSSKSSQDLTAVAGAVEQLSASVDEISRQVTTAADVARQAVNRAEASQGTMRGLAEATSRIGDVLHLISDIAGQTNLLALNATIEAARAGEAGRGFAVVAGEVKALAAQTAKATADIGSQIDTVRAVTADAVGAMAEIGSIIGRMDEVAAAIAAAVEEQGITTREIAHSIQAVSGATSETAQAMAHVVHVAGDAGSASREVEAGATNIGLEAETLRATVDEFLATVQADSGERRRFERIAGNGVIAMLRVAGREAVRAVVRDLSRSGVGLAGQPVPAGTQVEVELPDAGGMVLGLVSHAAGGTVGIVFREDAATLTRVDRALLALGARHAA
jgi:methyl-accepting chemotaxis protein